MRCNRFGVRILTLCLTFCFGLLTADWFSAERVVLPEEIKPEEIKRVVVTLDPKKMRYDSAKPQCKKFFDDFNTVFTNEPLIPIEKQTKVRISKKMKANREEIEAQKVEEEALKILKERKKKFESVVKEIDRAICKSNTANNLLYIENCVEYY